jgi:hypothetical protein
MVSAIVLVAVSTRQAKAGGMPKMFGYVMVGLSLGLQNDGNRGGLFGVEISYNQHQQDVTWLGLYGELRYDTVNDGAFISFGGQVFGPFVGIDAGPVLRLGQGGYGAGLRARLCLSLIVASACGGGGYESVNGGFGEFTALVKIPVEL